MWIWPLGGAGALGGILSSCEGMIVNQKMSHSAQRWILFELYLMYTF